MAGIAAYHRAIEAARAAALSLSRSQESAFLRLLEQYAEELAARVSAGLASKGERQALAIATEIIQQLTRDMAVATRNGVTLSAERVSQIIAKATTELIAGEGPLSTPVMPGIGARAAAAVLSRPSLAATFRSIQRDSVKAVDRILARALLRGASSTELARELRLHVLGADAFSPALLVDRRRIGYEAIRRMGYEATAENLRKVRADAGDVAARAQLIARTEVMNTEWEVHRQGAIDSPVVKAIEWRISGRHPELDECDVLAQADLFGMGPGLYDPRRLPQRPHPRCLCLQIDVLFDPEEWGQPRPPAPGLQVDLVHVGSTFALRPSQQRSLERVVHLAASGGGMGPKRATATERARAPKAARPLSKRAIAQGMRQAITAREKQIAPLGVEWATAWDPATGAQVLNKTDNHPARVNFDAQQRALLKDKVMTHNHPSSNSFSRADLGFAIQHDLAEIRVASRLFDYRMTRPAGGWPDLGAVSAASYDTEAELVTAWQKKNGTFSLPAGEELRDIWHRHWARVFRAFGISYRRAKRIP